MLATAGSSRSTSGCACAAWAMIVGTAPSIHGHTHSGALQARSSTVVTSTRSHEVVRRRSALTESRPSLSG
jgi:hypothetical protein